MSINERFFRDIVKTITENDDETLATKLYTEWEKNNFKLEENKLFELLGVKGYKIDSNNLYDENLKILVSTPTDEEKENAYRVLKDNFENAFKSRDKYFKENNIEPEYSVIIPKLIDGCRVELKKSDYREQYDVNIINNSTGENVYELYQKLDRIILTEDERQEFYKMLKWYVFNVPYSEMNPIEFESSFMVDVISKYYIYQKNNGKKFDNLETLLVICENGHPFTTPYYRNARISWGSDRWAEFRDHFKEDRCYKNCFFSYSSDGMKISEPIPRFNLEELYFYFPQEEDAKLIVDNYGKYFDLLEKKYVNISSDELVSFKDLFLDNGYNDILNKLPVTHMQQIRYLYSYLKNQINYDLKFVENLCKSTVDMFVEEVNVISKDIEKYKRELTLKLIIDYVINDGEFDYLFNIRDDRRNKPNYFEFDTLSGNVKSVVTLNINKDKTSYKKFLGEEKELVDLSNTKQI